MTIGTLLGTHAEMDGWFGKEGFANRLVANQTGQSEVGAFKGKLGFLMAGKGKVTW
jgi:hypothetical protein